jgi:hypothetical protein
MALQDEIESASREIQTDGYPMSIGELITLYKEGDLDLHPEFQREFRWKLPQKSRLIESILLGIPVPTIFVFQRADGIWDVIDGLQRLGTILEFVGDLKDEEKKQVAPLQLSKTRYLPSLAGKYWQSGEEETSLTDVQRRLIKRAKLDIKIVKNDSSQTSKYELFDRLNTGGSMASDQEVRDCLLIMANRSIYVWMKALAQDENFKLCTSLSSRQLEEKYDLELVLRFLVFKDLPNDKLGFQELGDFLTERMLAYATGEAALDLDQSRLVFEKTFAALVDSGMEEDAFRKFDTAKNKFRGAFSISSYEAVSLGLAARFTQNNNAKPPGVLDEIIKALWQNGEFLKYSGSGVRASTRVPKTVPLARGLFA